MKVLLVLTYYRPHISGLTIYVERLARLLAERGHQVTVLTSRFRSTLPAREIIDGVHVIRHPVAFRLSKGAIMPGFLLRALRLMGQHDVINLHLPQAEGGPLAFLGRILARKPVVVTYHCDLLLPPGMFNRLIDQAVFSSNMIAGALASRIVAYTSDYAVNSRFLSRFPEKVRLILPPVEMQLPGQEEVERFRSRLHLENGLTIGFAARFAEEKGIGTLLDAIPLVLKRYPHAKFIFAGESQQVIGENVWGKLKTKFEEFRQQTRILGPIPNNEMGVFFSACDLLVVPSTNSTESFGLVQVEAMLCACPVVASDLPGVREPIRITGMGKTVPVKDAQALAEAIIALTENRKDYIRPRNEVASLFSMPACISAYENLFHSLVRAKQSIPPTLQG